METPAIHEIEQLFFDCFNNLTKSRSGYASFPEQFYGGKATMNLRNETNRTKHNSQVLPAWKHYDVTDFVNEEVLA